MIFTPWLTGERSPIDDSNASAGFHNVSLATDRAAMVRAVLEGVAYNNHWLHEAVEKFAKRRLDPIRVFGGGAQSDLWCQIHADVMDRTIERVADPLHTGLRGAAILAGIALGDVDRGGAHRHVPVDATFRPDPASTRGVRPPLRRVPEALQGAEGHVPATQPAGAASRALGDGRAWARQSPHGSTGARSELPGRTRANCNQNCNHGMNLYARAGTRSIGSRNCRRSRGTGAGGGPG